nr:30 kda Ig-binding protein peptide V8-2 [Pseudomonas maltophilia, ATCC 13637, Peptide Partial, 8 aa] [Stenotrophomonas maltophilia]
ADPEAADY